MVFKSIIGAVCACLFAANVNAAMLSESIDQDSEILGPFVWGDGVNDLYQDWSSRIESGPVTSGWFYGANYYGDFSNTDVYVYSDLEDISTVTDASIFPYTTYSAEYAEEGDTVFFRGTNGYYGAWRIDSIRPKIYSDYPVYLTGQWYFLDDQTADFSVTSVPIPAAVWLFGSGLIGLIGLARRKA